MKRREEMGVRQETQVIQEINPFPPPEATQFSREFLRRLISIFSVALDLHNTESISVATV